MERELNRGDCARLKSGGPVVVIFYIRDDEAYCRWLEGRKLGGAFYKLDDLECLDTHATPLEANSDAR